MNDFALSYYFDSEDIDAASYIVLDGDYGIIIDLESNTVSGG